MTHPGIATNTMTLHRPVFGMFDNSIIFLDGIELVKFNGQQYKGGSESWNGINPILIKESTGTYAQRLIPAHTNHSTWDHYTLDVVMGQHSVPEQIISVLLTSANYVMGTATQHILFDWQNLSLHEGTPLPPPKY